MTHTSKAIAEIRERLEKATPGPWKIGHWTEKQTLDFQIFNIELEVTPVKSVSLEDDARLIVHCPTDLARLTDALEVAVKALSTPTGCGASDGLKAGAIAEIEKIMGEP